MEISLTYRKNRRGNKMKKILIALSLTLMIPGKILSEKKELTEYEKKLSEKVIKEVKLPKVLEALKEVEKSGKYEIKKFNAKKLGFKKLRGTVTQINITDNLGAKDKIKKVGLIAKRNIKCPSWLIFNEKAIHINTGKYKSITYKLPITKKSDKTMKDIVKKIQKMVKSKK